MMGDNPVLLAFLGLMAANYAAFFGASWHRRMWLFWTVQALNLVGACYLLLWGIPSFRESSPFVNYVLGGLVIARSLFNGRRLQSSYRDAVGAEEEVLDERRAKVKDKLRGSDPSDKEG